MFFELDVVIVKSSGVDGSRGVGVGGLKEKSLPATGN
jgi:hypothetical protein